MYLITFPQIAVVGRGLLVKAFDGSNTGVLVAYREIRCQFLRCGVARHNYTANQLSTFYYVGVKTR